VKDWFRSYRDQEGMNNVLTITPEKCTGCRTCELLCSFFHEKEFNPCRSRVSVISWEKEGFSVPMMCLQCSDAACMQVCPVGAVKRDPETGAMLVDHSRCIRCKMCTNACPFGNNTYDVQLDRILKCDLCGGDPQCARFCPSGAISYVKDLAASTRKKKMAASKFKELFREVV